MSELAATNTIKLFPDPILRTAAVEWQKGTDYQADLNNLQRLMTAAAGQGIAAQQGGLLAPLIIFRQGEKIRPLLAPQIIWRSEEVEEAAEGCLSLPGITVIVPRAEKIVVAAHSQQEEEIEMSLSGLDARVVQHEVDHLGGKLIIDYLPWLERRLLYS